MHISLCSSAIKFSTFYMHDFSCSFTTILCENPFIVIHNFQSKNLADKPKEQSVTKTNLGWKDGWREGGRDETHCEFRKRSSTWRSGLPHPRDAHLIPQQHRAWIGGHAVFPLVYVENGRARGSSVTQRGRRV